MLHVSFVLAEYLRRNVLPAEQHVASDLPRILHADSHLKALKELHCQRTRVDGILSPTKKMWNESHFNFCLSEVHV